MGGTPQTIGNRTLFYYGAYSKWNADVGGACNSDKTHCSGIGIASMLRDRFAALQPINASFPAQLTTKVLTLGSASCITVNVDARNGNVRAELLDSFGYRVHGYEVGNASAIETNDVAAKVEWKTVSTMPTGEYSLRLHFTGHAGLCYWH